jgi:hypothetical protein
MKDTLKTVVKMVETQTNDSIDLISKVDSFYNNAWDKLIIIGSVAFAIVGIVVPLVIQWYQKKTLKLSEELLKKEMEAQIGKIKDDIIGEITDKMETKIKDYEVKINRLNASTNAKAFHLQGNLSLDKELYQSALGDYITAGFDYLMCDDYQNLQTVLNLIATNCIPNLSIEEIDDLKTMTGNDLVALIEELESKDNNGALTRIIRDIKLKQQKAPKTIKDKPAIQS